MYLREVIVDLHEGHCGFLRCGMKLHFVEAVVDALVAELVHARLDVYRRLHEASTDRTLK